MNSKLQELRDLIRREVKAVLDETSKADDIKAQITKTQTDIEKKSGVETKKLSDLYTQLGAELKKNKP